MKKFLLLLLSLSLLLGALCAGAEDNAQILMQYMPQITALNGTDLVIVTEKFSHWKSLYTTEGEKQAEFPFTDLQYLNYGYFLAWNGEGVNNRALVHVNGRQITEAAYGQISVYNNHWAVGFVLSAAEEGSFKRGNATFNVDYYDIFYIPDESAETKPIGRLEAGGFKNADAHGEYLSVLDTSDAVTLFDSKFEICDYAPASVAAPVYVITDYVIMNAASGQQVKDGFTEVKEQKVQNGLYLIGTRFNYKGQKVAGVLTPEGEELMPVEYFVSSVTDKYALVTDGGTLRGLYSLEQQKQIVPSEFTAIVTMNTANDPYVFNGYAIVENGDLRGYYDTVRGELSTELKYDKTAVITVGCTTYWQKEEGVFMLAAADGVETEIHVDSIERNSSRGDGYYLVAKKDGLFGVIDWHGNEILPFIHNRGITITDDGQGAIRSSTGVELDKLFAASPTEQ